MKIASWPRRAFDGVGTPEAQGLRRMEPCLLRLVEGTFVGEYKPGTAGLSGYRVPKCAYKPTRILHEERKVEYARPTHHAVCKAWYRLIDRSNSQLTHLAVSLSKY